MRRSVQLKISQKVPSHSGQPDRECVVPDTGRNMEECKDQLPKEDPDKTREDIVKLIWEKSWPRRMRRHQSQSRKQQEKCRSCRSSCLKLGWFWQQQQTDHIHRQLSFGVPSAPRNVSVPKREHLIIGIPQVTVYLLWWHASRLFDVSTLKMQKEVLEVKFTNGDTFLEGELELWHALVTHMVEDFRKDQWVDITKDAMAPRQCMSQLKGQIESRPCSKQRWTCRTFWWTFLA